MTVQEVGVLSNLLLKFKIKYLIYLLKGIDFILKHEAEGTSDEKKFMMYRVEVNKDLERLNNKLMGI